MTALMTIDFILLAAGLAIGITSYYSLVGELYRNHPNEWEALGCPTCFAAQMKSDKRARAIPNMTLQFVWLLKTPEWMTEKHPTIRWLWLMRVSSVVVWVTCLLWIVAFFKQVI